MSMSCFSISGTRYLVQIGSLNGSAWAIFSNWDLGFLTFTSCVIVVNLKLFAMTRFWCASTKIVYFGTLLFFLAFSLLYCGVRLSFLTSHHYMHLVFYQVFSLSSVWACLLAQVALALLPDAVALAYRSLTCHLDPDRRPLARFWNAVVDAFCCCCLAVNNSQMLLRSGRPTEESTMETSTGVEEEGGAGVVSGGCKSRSTAAGARRRWNEDREKDEAAISSIVAS